MNSELKKRYGKSIFDFNVDKIGYNSRPIEKANEYFTGVYDFYTEAKDDRYKYEDIFYFFKNGILWIRYEDEFYSGIQRERYLSYTYIKFIMIEKNSLDTNQFKCYIHELFDDCEYVWKNKTVKISYFSDFKFVNISDVIKKWSEVIGI